MCRRRGAWYAPVAGRRPAAFHANIGPEPVEEAPGFVDRGMSMLLNSTLLEPSSIGVRTKRRFDLLLSPPHVWSL